MTTALIHDQHWYSNNDVTSDRRLYDAATEYAAKYEGTYEPLVQAKTYYEEYGFITTTTARKVLNCMKHDVNVSEWLETLRKSDKPDTDGVYSVPKQRKSTKVKDKQCSQREPHYGHYWESEGAKKGRFTCEGVDWPINRHTSTAVPALIKVRFAGAKTGALIHLLASEGHEFWWRVEDHHEWGWRKTKWWEKGLDGIWAPELSVNLDCKYPSRLTNPVLYKEEPTQLYDERLFGDKARKRCPHCTWRD